MIASTHSMSRMAPRGAANQRDDFASGRHGAAIGKTAQRDAFLIEFVHPWPCMARVKPARTLLRQPRQAARWQ